MKNYYRIPAKIWDKLPIRRCDIPIISACDGKILSRSVVLAYSSVTNELVYVMSISHFVRWCRNGLEIADNRVFEIRRMW